VSLYVPLDTDYYHDPRIIDAGPMAELLYVRSLCLAKRAEKDGFIAASQLRVIGSGLSRPRDLAARLCAVGAWEAQENGWVITAWLKRNKSAAQLAHQKEAQRMKSLMGNHERWHAQAGKYDPTCELCNPHGDPNGDPQSDPHGDPKRKEVKRSESEAKRSEVKPREENSSSSSVLTVVPSPVDDDDDIRKVLDLIAEARTRGRRLDNPRAYRAAIRTNALTEDGELIRRMLKDGDGPATVALFVLGHGAATVAELEETPSIPWCGPDCQSCDGTAWVDVGNGLAPCPERRTA
jgi:hypothetical protein